MTAPVTAAVVVGLWDHLRATYRTTVVTKADAGQMKELATLLDALGVVDRDRFLREFATTIGRTIYLPFTPGEATPAWDLWALTVAATSTSVLACARAGVRGRVRDQQHARARHEAEAFLTQIEPIAGGTGSAAPVRRETARTRAGGRHPVDAKYLALAVGHGGSRPRQARWRWLVAYPRPSSLSGRDARRYAGSCATTAIVVGWVV
jgi:hypothetical protein